MKFDKKAKLLQVILLGAMVFSCQEVLEPEMVLEEAELVSSYSQVIPDQYIVTLKPTSLNFRKTQDYESNQASMRKFSENLLASYRVKPEVLKFIFSTVIDGFSVKLDKSQYESLKSDPRVSHIERDQVIVLGKPTGSGKGGGKKSSEPTDPEPTPLDPDPTPTDPEPTPVDPEPSPTSPAPDDSLEGPSTQEIPWGIKRVGGPVKHTGNNIAFVLDTGIDFDHPDLNVLVSWGKKIVPDEVSATLNDLHGHGTHVAGIIGAKNNTFGVVGVAAGAWVVPVKVMGDDGRGSVSYAIAGIDYVLSVGRPGDVINLSIGSGASTSFDNAVIKASNMGIWVVTSAGNSAADANNYSPARANGPYIQTVSSMSSSGTMASSSNYGNPPIDWAAPGVSIRSTLPNGAYGSKSGTSMASPHVAGLRLLGGIRADGYISGDKDASPDPIAFRAF
ncbi:S8 family serine peptidase [Algoriphagus aestuariicola]|jgi:hypothetical protein|uniref:S8 family serine peptidase n=1 Tax=Algoriphagus aestuariicola TaxID=1852016 RepID=A0ABS3BSD0_9BACT|nr:S8 family serine peptidase [Algoriphagus aestuariicola]MBN7802213.1 S8 family serine peptidase [Algoriphagus aestuariicola]